MPSPHPEKTCSSYSPDIKRLCASTDKMTRTRAVQSLWLGLRPLATLGYWLACLTCLAHSLRDGQPGFGCFDFPREMLLAGSWYIQAAVFSFRNTSVLNQGFRNGDRGHLLPTRTTSGLWATLVTRTPPGTMLRWDQPSLQQAQTHSCRSCLVEGMGGLRPFPPPHPEQGPSTVPPKSSSSLPHTHPVRTLPSPLQESHSTHHPCLCTMSMWLLENTDGGHPVPILQPQGTGLELHTRKPRKTTPSTTSTPHPTASTASSYHHYTCTCSRYI
jgi:hypothetical protein